MTRDQGNKSTPNLYPNNFFKTICSMKISTVYVYSVPYFFNDTDKNRQLPYKNKKFI